MLSSSFVSTSIFQVAFELLMVLMIFDANCFFLEMTIAERAISRTKQDGSMSRIRFSPFTKEEKPCSDIRKTILASGLFYLWNSRWCNWYFSNENNRLFKELIFQISIEQFQTLRLTTHLLLVTQLFFSLPVIVFHAILSFVFVFVSFVLESLFTLCFFSCHTCFLVVIVI